MPTLTDLMLRQTPTPATDRTELRDDKVSGLVFRITSTGARSWSLSYRVNGARQRLTLGEYRTEDSTGNGLTLGEARKAARAALREVEEGRDPQGAKRALAAETVLKGETFAAVVERWFESRAARKWKPKTRAEFTRIARVELVPVLGDLAPEAITKRHIRALHDRLSDRSESVATHTLAVLRVFFKWASDEDRVETVPVFPKGESSKARTRILEDSELRAVVAALDRGIGQYATTTVGGVSVMAEAFRLMLLTGQRRGEVLSMRWDNVTEEKDGAWWTIPAERSKNGNEQRVPLTAPAVEALKRLHSVKSGEWVFPAPKATAKVPYVGNPQKAAERLWKVSGVKGATVHDLRRTVATMLARLGVYRLVIGRVLGHTDADVTGRYDKHAYDVEKRAALAKWAKDLDRIVRSKDEAPGKVLPWVAAR